MKSRAPSETSPLAKIYGTLVRLVRGSISTRPRVILSSGTSFRNPASALWPMESMTVSAGMISPGSSSKEGLNRPAASNTDFTRRVARPVTLPFSVTIFSGPRDV